MSHSMFIVPANSKVKVIITRAIAFDIRDMKRNVIEIQQITPFIDKATDLLFLSLFLSISRSLSISFSLTLSLCLSLSHLKIQYAYPPFRMLIERTL